jgi:hypothetical protein
MANDHYVPRFHLRNFQIEERPGWIYSYKKGMKPKAMAIRSVASKDEYYTLKRKDVDVDRNFPDQFFQLLETQAAPVIKRLLTAADINLTNGERVGLAWFMAALAQRTPWARERLINLDKVLEIRRIKRICENKELFEEIARKKEPEISPEELEQMRQSILDFENHLTLRHAGDVGDHFLAQAIVLSESLVPVFLMKQWMLMECPTEQVFVTSDNPVILLPPANYRHGMPAGYLNWPIFFPLSPKRALKLSHLKGRGVVKVWGQDMDQMVGQTIVYGHKAVFSNVISEEFQEIFDSVPEGETTKAYV